MKERNLLGPKQWRSSWGRVWWQLEGRLSAGYQRRRYRNRLCLERDRRDNCEQTFPDRWAAAGLTDADRERNYYATFLLLPNSSQMSLRSTWQLLRQKKGAKKQTHQSSCCCIENTLENGGKHKRKVWNVPRDGVHCPDFLSFLLFSEAPWRRARK